MDGSRTPQGGPSARTIAAGARAGIALAGLAIVARDPALHPHPLLAALGMGVIAGCAFTQMAGLNARIGRVEESVAAIAGVLVNGLGDERVTVLTLLWLAAVITGALVRARVDLLAAAIFVAALGLPIVMVGSLHASYIGLCVAAAALLLSGRAVMSELEALLELARHEADHDGLTGALARAAFRAGLTAALAGAAEASPLALVMVDLDRFGLINKLHGHAAGDLLLAKAVEEMRDLGDRGSLVGRLGGDEFAITVAKEPERFAEELLLRLAEPAGGAPSTAGSVGIAWAPRDGRDADALLRAGDVALRVAKRSRQRSVASYTGESLSGDGERDVETILARPIGGEGIEIVTQPIFDLAGETHAYEALARFQLGSTTSPLHWFSLAEEFGERDALEQACLSAAIQLLPELPAQARLASISPAPPFPTRKRSPSSKRPPTSLRLVVEITEDTLVRNDDLSLAAAIAILRRRGTRLAVDDMGAGYAGLRQITAVYPDDLSWTDRSSAESRPTPTEPLGQGDGRLRRARRRARRCRGSRDGAGAVLARRPRRPPAAGISAGPPGARLVAGRHAPGRPRAAGTRTLSPG